MELQIIEKKSVEALPVQLQEFVSAKLGKPSIKDMKPVDLELQLQDMFTRCFAEMGHTSAGTAEVMTFLRTTLMNDLSAPKFRHFTLEEIRLFISKGIRGEYETFRGQMNSINIQNIHHWIRQGIASKDREMAMAEFNRQMEFESAKKTDVPIHLKVQRSKEGCLNAFKEYKETGLMPFASFAYYDVLNEIIGKDYNDKKTLVTDPEIRKKIFKETEEELTSEILKEKVKREKRGDMTEVSLLMQKLESGLNKDKGLEHKRKTLLLKYFFDSLIKEGKELEL